MTQLDGKRSLGGVNDKIDRGMKSLHEKIRETFSIQPVLVPFLAIVLAVIVGGILMWITGSNPFDAYWALLRGMVGSWKNLAASISRSTPYVGSALAMAFAFKAGLFNIGVEGQLIAGGVAAGWAATWAFTADLPGILAIPLVLLVGVVAGGLWAGVPGVLRSRTGAHEVISAIMMNNIAILLFTWIVNSRDPVILADPNSTSPRTRPVAAVARLPELVASTPRLHLGTFVMIALCVLFSFLLMRTVYGFEVRTTGANPGAAHYAGISVNRIIVTVMLISGAMAGLAAAGEVSGTYHFFTPGALRSIGFDGIAIALLARANPYAILPAALLWGSMLSGAGLMQQEAGVSIDVVRIVLSLVLLFVAADAIVRYVFRIRAPRLAVHKAEGIL